MSQAASAIFFRSGGAAMSRGKAARRALSLQAATGRSFRSAPAYRRTAWSSLLSMPVRLEDSPNGHKPFGSALALHPRRPVNVNPLSRQGVPFGAHIRASPRLRFAPGPLMTTGVTHAEKSSFLARV